MYFNNLRWVLSDGFFFFHRFSGHFHQCRCRRPQARPARRRRPSRLRGRRSRRGRRWQRDRQKIRSKRRAREPADQKRQMGTISEMCCCCHDIIYLWLIKMDVNCLFDFNLVLKNVCIKSIQRDRMRQRDKETEKQRDRQN